MATEMTKPIVITADDSALVQQLNESGVCPPQCRTVTIVAPIDQIATITYECFLTPDVVDALPPEISEFLRSSSHYISKQPA